MTKTITLEAPPLLQEIVVAALRTYAEAAYPPGGSECGQVARGAIMDVARAMELGFSEHGRRAEVSRRMRANLKSAIRYFCEQPAYADYLPCLEKMIEGEIITEFHLKRACRDV